MNKYILLTFIPTLLVHICIAQSSMGFKFGCNLTSLTITDSVMGQPAPVTAQNYPRIQYGLILDIFLNKIVSVETELIMAKKGGIYIRDSVDISLKTKLNYLELPIMAKLSLGFDLKAKKHKKKKGNRRITIHGKAGPYLGYCLRGKWYYTSFGVPYKTDVLAQVEQWNYGLYAGGGIAYKKNGTTWFVSLKKEWGWKNVNKFLWDVSYRVKTLGTEISAGIMFDF